MKLTGAQIIIKELIRNGADTVFGYPGGSVLDIYDELYSSRDEIKHIITAHEQGAAHAADGYAKATGKTGVVIATSGPGATNLVTGLATAYLDSVPLVALTGNVATDFIGLDSFQEVSIVGITMPVTKHNYLVRDVRELAATVREAFKLAKSGRPGPVLIDVPKDVQKKCAEYGEAYFAGQDADSGRSADVDLAEAAAMIRESKKPCVYVGGGAVISGASEEVIAFSESIDAPIAASLMGLTAVPNGYGGFLGMAGMHGRYAASKALYECDLLIALGSRFSDRATGNKRMFAKNSKILQIDIDRAEINKNIRADCYAVGDVKALLKRLTGAGLGGDGALRDDRRKWYEYIAELKNSKENRLPAKSAGSGSALTPGYVIKEVCKALGRDAVVATDVGQHQMWTAQYYEFNRPRSLVTSGGLGTMGYGMGAAIGASVGTGFRSLLFTSDGSFHMNLNELATAVSHKIPLTVILLDNNALGMVRQWQTMFYHERYSETTLNRKTDYVKLAEAFGASGMKAEDADGLEAALKIAKSIDGPFLIHCKISGDEKVFPMIPPNGTIKDIIIR